ncbi:CAP domain-containing protein [Streptomyces sp. NPDC053048]|uniref:CAP domain-containing protein n=1 Tax=Streptomyces sp. NPDC053048 TaxID=3365694 RepID=UPI0037D78401
MNREPETSTFDPAPDGTRRARRRGGRRPRRAVVVTGAVALAVVVGGGYGVAQSMGGGSGDTGSAAEAASVRAAEQTSGEPGVPPAAGGSAAPAANPSGTPRSASPSANASVDANAAASGKSGKKSGADKSGDKSADTSAGTGSRADAKAGAASGVTAEDRSKAAAKSAPTSGQSVRKAPRGKGNGSHVQQVVDMVNAERARHGCSPVTVNAKLQAAAQGHSDDMAARDYYDHTSPEGRGPGDRISAAGYRWSTYGENIFKSPKDARTAMDGWMKSPGHRSNILNCAFKEMGVGVNFSSNGPWWTQNFAASS